MQNIRNIFDDCGLIVQRYERVHGGDINEAYCLFTSTAKYFLKLNNKNDYPLMLEKEAKGLDLLRHHFILKIPQVIKAGICGDRQYLLLEWLDKASSRSDTQEKFGHALALMHKQPQQYFGLDQNNYIGSLEQVNKPYDNWHSFYTECRIMPLVTRLFDMGCYSSKDIANAEAFCLEFRNMFPAEPPALLHGDLWAGNYLIHVSGDVAIYDPAVYFGHREMDIGMTKLFGGFDRAFYNAYNHYYPLEKDWEQRLPLTQLYPILVHAVLFGGHYISSAMNVIKRLYR